MSAPINIGDKVRFEWEHLEPVEGVLKHMPCATGDCWVIEAEPLTIFGISERTIHIQNFARVTNLKQKQIQ